MADRWCRYGYLALFLIAEGEAAVLSIATRIQASSDDVEHRDGSYYSSSSDLELGHDGSRDNDVGVRFINVGVPAGSTIRSAHIVFTTDNTDSVATSVRISAEKVANPPTFSPGNAIPHRQTRLTDASVMWNSIPPWMQSNAEHQTPDLAALVQEVIELPGWATGNSIVFIFDQGIGERTAHSFDGVPNAAPLLVIEYEDDSPSSPPPAPGMLFRQISSGSDDVEFQVGFGTYFDSSDLELGYDGSVKNIVALRFVNIDVPQGAVVLSAHIEMYAEDVDIGPIAVVIRMQAADDASPFTPFDSPATRATSSASVTWDMIPSWNVVDELHQTPDLAILVQQIFSRPGWQPGNSVVVVLDGNMGTRSARSYNYDPALAPRLVVEFSVSPPPTSPPPMTPAPPVAPYPCTPPETPPFAPPAPPTSPLPPGAPLEQQLYKVAFNVWMQMPPSPPPPLPPTIPPTYIPGDLTILENGLYLSTGLSSRLIAVTGWKVPLADGSFSNEIFHDQPDAGATFKSPDGGWVYVSNAEVGGGAGGVGAITFNANGDPVGYQMVLTGTSRNCGGGKTPWGTWLTCEETGGGQVWEVDPFGMQSYPQYTQLGGAGGEYESVAYDNSTGQLHFFITEDTSDGALRRFTPVTSDPASIHQSAASGETRYLKLNTDGTFTWTSSIVEGRASASAHFPKTEGIDCRNGVVYFTSKTAKMLFTLYLDTQTFVASSTVSGAFNNQPDQIASLVGSDILYFCEDGGDDCGVHGRDGTTGAFFSILDGPWYDTETTGLAFSPDRKHMYVSFQGPGYIFDITRQDGYPFHGGVLDIKYHGDT